MRWPGEIDYPMYIVTVAHDGERSGSLVGFATQCSIDPIRFLVCLSDNNRTYRIAQETEALGVHLVPANGAELAELFGSRTGDDVDKFARCSWREGPRGVPLLDDCPNWFAGHVLGRLNGGDHQALLVELFESSEDGVSRFEFHRAKRLEPGHEA